MLEVGSSITRNKERALRKLNSVLTDTTKISMELTSEGIGISAFAALVEIFNTNLKGERVRRRELVNSTSHGFKSARVHSNIATLIRSELIEGELLANKNRKAYSYVVTKKGEKLISAALSRF